MLYRCTASNSNGARVGSFQRAANARVPCFPAPFPHGMIPWMRNQTTLHLCSFTSYDTTTDTCDMIEIFGSQFDGTYMDLGWTFGGKPLFFSMGDLTPHVMFYSEGGMSSSSSSGDSADGEGEETRRGRLLQNAGERAQPERCFLRSGQHFFLSKTLF